MKDRKIATCLCGAGESEVQLAWRAVWGKGGSFGRIWHVECLRCGRRTEEETIPQFAVIEWEEMVSQK